MATLPQIQSEASAVAGDPNLAQNNVVEHGKDLIASLTIAKVVKILGTLWSNAAIPMNPNAARDLATATALEWAVNADPNLVVAVTSARTTPSQAIITRLNWTLWALRAPLTTKISTAELVRIKNEVDNQVRTNVNTIRADEWLILFIAELKHLIAQKENDQPLNPTILAIWTQTSLPFNITWTKTGWVPINQKVEIVDISWNIIVTQEPNGNNTIQVPITSIPNGRHLYKVRCTNPATDVYSETSITLDVNVAKEPEAPTNVIVSTPEEWTQWTISGILTTSSHDIEVLDGDWNQLNPRLISPSPNVIIDRVTGNFNIRLPGNTSGNYEFILRISRTWWRTYDQRISQTVKERTASMAFIAPTFAPENIANRPPLYNPTNIPHWIHDPLIELNNATPGSQIEVSGWGIQTQVINVPLGHHDAHIHLHGLDTSHHGTKNLTIKYTDPQNPSNPPKIFPFDVNVTENLHHEPDNLRISETNFLAAIPTGNYVLQNNAAGRGPYRVGRLKRALWIGWWAEVPVLPWEERIFWLRKTLKSTSRRWLYTKVRQYIEQRNAQAKAMNHSDHAHDTPHDPAHPETTAPTPGATPSSAEAHTDAAHPAAHPTGAHPASEGTFYDLSVENILGHGLLGKAFIGLKNFFPKKLREIAGGTTVSVKNWALAGAGVWLTGAGMASLGIGWAATVAWLAPLAAVATFGYYAYQRMRYGRKGKEENGAKASEASH